MHYEAVECFWVEPNGRSIRTLRRYSRGRGGNRCPYMAGEYSYHTRSVEIGEFDATWTKEPHGKYVGLVRAEEYEGDPRWPTRCECGYEFKPDDEWQAGQEPIYESEDGRRAWTSPAHRRQPTPGAMFDTFWRPELRKTDGLAISVVCPNGQVWCIDDKATSGGFWTREGTPPKLTVSPSIVAGDYHGFLRNGVLTASL